MPIVKKTLSEVSPAIRAAFQKAQDVLSKNSLDYGIELLKEITKKDPGFLDSRIMLRKAEKTKYAHMNIFQKILAHILCIPPILKGGALVAKKPLEALHQKAGPPLLPARTQTGPGHQQSLTGPGAALIDGGHLPVEQVPPALLHLQAAGAEQCPVILRKQAGRIAYLGQRAVIRPQKKQYLHRVPRLALQLPRRHPVQGHGDGAHVILGEPSRRCGRPISSINV